MMPLIFARLLRWFKWTVLLFVLAPLVSVAGDRVIERLGEPLVETGETEALAAFGLGAGDDPLQHPTVDGSNHEQLVLELINRARLDPLAEAARLGIDLNEELAAGTINPAPKQPLAPNPELIHAARAHSAWMLEANVFSHTGQGGSVLRDRMEASAYPLSGSWTIGENIGWGGTTGSVDMQEHAIERHDNLFLSSGHRVNLMNDGFEEIGLGFLEGQFLADGTNWNASMLTQKFAASGGTPGPLMTGVIYHDFNGNGLYDINEGVDQVRVSLEGEDAFVLSGTSGAYALLLPSNADSLNVTFTYSGMETVVSVESPGDRNVKLDFEVSSRSAPMLSLSEENRDHGSAALATAELNIESNIAWQVSTDAPEWLTLAVSDGLRDGVVGYALVENTTGAERSAEIRVSGGGLFRSMTVTQSGSALTEPWYSAAAHLDDGWRFFDWFKGFRPGPDKWIFHGRHGWLFVQADNTQGMFLWDVAMRRWLWTNENVYPWMYAYGPGEGWVFFFEGGRPGSRFFQRGDTGATVSEEDLRVP